MINEEAVTIIINDIKRKYADDGYRGINESQTRCDYVDPLLRALGWCGKDKILREVAEGKERYDYLLLYETERVALETKREDEAVKDPTFKAQCARYCHLETVLPYCIICNGHEFIIYGRKRDCNDLIQILYINLINDIGIDLIKYLEYDYIKNNGGLRQTLDELIKRHYLVERLILLNQCIVTQNSDYSNVYQSIFQKLATLVSDDSNIKMTYGEVVRMMRKFNFIFNVSNNNSEDDQLLASNTTETNVDQQTEEENNSKTIRVTIPMLLTAGQIKIGETLFFVRSKTLPLNMIGQGTLNSDGTIAIDDEKFKTLSNAILKFGYKCSDPFGYTLVLRDSVYKSLNDLRKEYLNAAPTVSIPISATA